MKQIKLNKINSVLKQIVWESILRNTLEIQDNFWLITVNNVKLSADISYLDIFVSSLKNQELLCKTLAKNAQIIKEDINKKISLRKTPIIRFKYDNKIELSTELISKIDLLYK